MITFEHRMMIAKLHPDAARVLLDALDQYVSNNDPEECAPHVDTTAAHAIAVDLLDGLWAAFNEAALGAVLARHSGPILSLVTPEPPPAPAPAAKPLTTAQARALKNVADNNGQRRGGYRPATLNALEAHGLITVDRSRAWDASNRDVAGARAWIASLTDLGRAYVAATAKLGTSYRDGDGEEHTLAGESVEAIAAQLPDDFRGDLTITDEHGFVRGWAHSRGEWRAT